MEVCEIFLSIQGESSFSGLPCIFVRFAGCNLNCEWCDTPYHKENATEMTINEIITEIRKYDGVELVELTGGEPLLQDNINDLISELSRLQYILLLETNGSREIENLPAELHKIVDVKCPSSGESASFNRNNLLYLDPETDELKFVIADRKDFEFARDFIHYNNLWGYRILFSCVFNRLEPATLVSWTLEEKLPIRFQLQLHKYIWNENERGR